MRYLMKDGVVVKEGRSAMHASSRGHEMMFFSPGGRYYIASWQGGDVPQSGMMTQAESESWIHFHDLAREAAIEALVEQDVARWGERERAASMRLHGALTYGRALNALAARAELAGEPYAELRAAADAALTAADWRELRQGG